MASTDQKNGVQRWAKRGVAAEELRRHNLATVLERLHLRGPQSRSQLTAATGLNRSTVGDLIGELSDLGMVEEGRRSAASGPGRPSPVVGARAAGAVVLSLQLDVDSIAAATIGLGGHIYEQSRVARPEAHHSPEEIVADIGALARPLLDALPERHNLVGVGAGVAGVTRRSDGYVHLAPNLGWSNVPLGELLTEELGLPAPILVANEADFGAFGEYRRGVRPGVRHLVYLFGEVGIGAGVVVEGEMLRGLAGYAGEVGHTKVNPIGRTCRCGGVGCWETEAGEAALLRHLGIEEAATGLNMIDAVVEQASAGIAETLEAIDEVGRWLGLGIANLVNTFNPEMVVLGGFYERLYPHLEPSISAELERSALAAPLSKVTIERGGLGLDAPLVGAAEAILAQALGDPAGAARSPQQVESAKT